jgi:hypothetical protein
MLRRLLRRRPRRLSLDPATLTPEQRAELIRNYLNDPEAQKRAARAYAAGLHEDALDALEG